MPSEVHRVECGSDLSGVCEIRWALDGISTYWTLHYHGCEDTGEGIECSVSMQPTPIVAEQAAFQVRIDELEQQLTMQTTMLRATQQRLAECRQREVEPDLSSAWVLGGLALLGVAARWWR